MDVREKVCGQSIVAANRNPVFWRMKFIKKGEIYKKFSKLSDFFLIIVINKAKPYLCLFIYGLYKKKLYLLKIIPI